MSRPLPFMTDQEFSDHMGEIDKQAATATASSREDVLRLAGEAVAEVRRRRAP